MDEQGHVAEARFQTAIQDIRQAELIIDVQKKVSEMIQTRSQEKTD